MPNKRRTPFYPVILGSIAVFSTIPALAAKWPMTPYGTLHSGVTIKTDWSAPWKEKFPPTGAPVFVGLGALLDPSILGGWIFSLEGMYHTKVVKLATQDNVKMHGGFISGKCTFPQSEGVENFIGIGVGGLWLPQSTEEKTDKKKDAKDKQEKNDKDKKENKTGFALTGIVYAGRNWHLNNGFYLTTRVSYLVPSGENNKQNLALTLGFYSYLI